MAYVQDILQDATVSVGEGYSELPGVVAECLRGDFSVDPCITHCLTHGQIRDRGFSHAR